MEDNDIITRIKGGDVEAFSLLVEKYHRKLLNFIFRLTGDEGNVEDIGQEVFLSVYKSLKGFDEGRGTPFSAWLFITARNRCISELRKRRGKEKVSIEDVPALSVADESVEETLCREERRQAVSAALGQLGEPYRSTLLRSLSGDSLDEIAKEQLLSCGTIKSRLFRAREKLRFFLNQYYGGKGYEGI